MICEIEVEAETADAARSDVADCVVDFSFADERGSLEWSVDVIDVEPSSDDGEA